MSVVLPAPKKPVTMVVGVALIGCKFMSYPSDDSS